MKVCEIKLNLNTGRLQKPKMINYRADVGAIGYICHQFDSNGGSFIVARGKSELEARELIREAIEQEIKIAKSKLELCEKELARMERSVEALTAQQTKIKELVDKLP